MDDPQRGTASGARRDVGPRGRVDFSAGYQTVGVRLFRPAGSIAWTETGMRGLSFGYRPRLLGRHEIKYPRAARANVDQLVLCPDCGNAMQFFGVDSFKCQCGQETTAEAVVAALAPA